MGKFLESEKLNQINFKITSPYFSAESHKDGIYKGKPRPFCLPLYFAEENLFPEIRQTALAYFSSYKIKWHDGLNGKPSNHLCDSQVCCLNFLFPFARKPDLLAVLFRPIFPNLKEMIPIENKQYVGFEWIGFENYLGEKVPAGGKRTRGANYTSADAAIKFKRNDGKTQMVLIEWKYTESYEKVNLKYSKSGTDRTKIYRKFYLQDDCILNKKILPGFDSLFYEPFYQFMRQQFLAYEMEKAEYPEADIVSILHIAPKHNEDFHRITSPQLFRLGETAINIWKQLVRNHRFISTNTEELFYKLLTNKFPELQNWSSYISRRYSWIKNV